MAKMPNYIAIGGLFTIDGFRFICGYRLLNHDTNPTFEFHVIIEIGKLVGNEYIETENITIINRACTIFKSVNLTDIKELLTAEYLKAATQIAQSTTQKGIEISKDGIEIKLWIEGFE